jgi:xanthosine utilization system XapX-like protein
VYIGMVIGILWFLRRLGSPATYTLVILTLGGMHVLYDGFIWKRPSPNKAGMLVAP